MNQTMERTIILGIKCLLKRDDLVKPIPTDFLGLHIIRSRGNKGRRAKREFPVKRTFISSDKTP